MLIGFPEPVNIRELQFRYNREHLRTGPRFRPVQKARIEQPAGIDVSHGGEDVFFQMRILLFEIRRTGRAARAERCRFVASSRTEPPARLEFGISAGDVFGNKDQRPDEAVIVIAGMGDRRAARSACR